jgi:4-alpha-glucanotransferase
VDRAALEAWHAPRVQRAASRLAATDRDAVRAFGEAHSWARDHARHVALTRAHKVSDWRGLPPPLRERDAAALAEADHRHSGAIATALAAQLLFDRQWRAVREAARARGIRIVGDVPIFVGTGSADVWAHRALFRGGPSPEGWAPDPVTGVPPDYFSPLGQRWGNPHYAWAAHADDGFSWWVARFRRAFALADVVRVDHFRGFAGAWEIPAADPDATGGTWAPAPGDALFGAVRDALGGLPLIAEDLGDITPDVEALRLRLGLPGMKILQFAFDGNPENPYLPDNYRGSNWLVYTGTHDNATCIGWWNNLGDEQRRQVESLVGPVQAPGWQLLELALSSRADWALVPLQDLLHLGDEARFNIPGTSAGNWQWRLSCPLEAISGPLLGLGEMARRHQR